MGTARPLAPYLAPYLAPCLARSWPRAAPGERGLSQKAEGALETPVTAGCQRTCTCQSIAPPFLEGGPERHVSVPAYRASTHGL